MLWKHLMFTVINVIAVCYGQPPPILPNPGPGIPPGARIPPATGGRIPPAGARPPPPPGGRVPQIVLPNTNPNAPPGSNPMPNPRPNTRPGMPPAPGSANNVPQCTSTGRETIARCFQVII